MIPREIAALADCIIEECEVDFEQSIEIAHAIAKRLRAQGLEIREIAK